MSCNGSAADSTAACLAVEVALHVLVATVLKDGLVFNFNVGLGFQL